MKLEQKYFLIAIASFYVAYKLNSIQIPIVFKQILYGVSGTFGLISVVLEIDEYKNNRRKNDKKNKTNKEKKTC